MRVARVGRSRRRSVQRLLLQCILLNDVNVDVFCRCDVRGSVARNAAQGADHAQTATLVHQCRRAQQALLLVSVDDVTHAAVTSHAVALHAREVHEHLQKKD